MPQSEVLLQGPGVMRYGVTQCRLGSIGTGGAGRPNDPLRVDPFGERQGILDVDRGAHRAVHLRTARQQFHSPEVARLLVDLRNLGPPHECVP